MKVKVKLICENEQEKIDAEKMADKFIDIYSLMNLKKVVKKNYVEIKPKGEK